MATEITDKRVEEILAMRVGEAQQKIDSGRLLVFPPLNEDARGKECRC